MINALSNQVIFLEDFNSRYKQFGCVKPNKSGQMLFNIAKDFKLFHVNQLSRNRHTREDPVHGTFDILNMAFLCTGLNSRDISFSIADDHMAVITSPCKFHLTSHSNGICHLHSHATDLTKPTMTYFTTH